jgi:hypothetical protein
MLRAARNGWLSPCSQSAMKMPFTRRLSSQARLALLAHPLALVPFARLAGLAASRSSATVAGSKPSRHGAGPHCGIKLLILNDQGSRGSTLMMAAPWLLPTHNCEGSTDLSTSTRRMLVLDGRR